MQIIEYKYSAIYNTIARLSLHAIFLLVSAINLLLLWHFLLWLRNISFKNSDTHMPKIGVEFGMIGSFLNCPVDDIEIH